MLFYRLVIFIGFIILVCALVNWPSPSLTRATAALSIDSAEVVHSSESMKVPPSVGTFVILIPNEAHENWSDEKHKLIPDHLIITYPNLGHSLSPSSEWIAQSGPIEDYVLQDMFEWLTSPARDVDEEIR
jgi:hypothetical protein